MSCTIPSTRRSRTRTALVGLAALSLAASVAVASTASAGVSPAKGNGKGPKGDPKGQLVDVQLLAFNDYHGHIERTTPGSFDGSRNGEAGGGGEFLSTKLSELRAGNKNSLTVAAGDLIGGSPFLSGLFHDEPSVETLNAMELDVSSVGNHEFDEGVTELLRMQNGGCHPVDGCYFPEAPYPGADFQWLSANVVDQAGDTPLPPYWIKKFQGVRVGFIGMTLEATDTLVAQSGIQGYDFLDEADTANALVPELQAKGVEAIVVLLHEGGTPTPFAINGCEGLSGPINAINANLDPAIDVLITGHTHQPYNCVIDTRIVTSAFSFGRVVSEVNLVIDKRTNDVRRDLSTATNHSVIQSQITPDPDITDIVAKWAAIGDVIGQEAVGQITGDILRGTTATGGEDRGVESSAGNLVADAQQWATAVNGAQIALMNPGGVRSDLLFAETKSEGEGVVTFEEAFTFQPFSNILITIPMTGAQIVGVLEEQCQPAGSSRPFLHLGVSEGITYDLQRTIVDGTCTGITISDLQLDGVAIEDDTTYLVTVNNFLVDGGDNFGTFATVDPSLRVGGGIDLDALNDYLGSEGPIDPPSIDRVNEVP